MIPPAGLRWLKQIARHSGPITFKLTESQRIRHPSAGSFRLQTPNRIRAYFVRIVLNHYHGSAEGLQGQIRDDVSFVGSNVLALTVY